MNTTLESLRKYPLIGKAYLDGYAANGVCGCCGEKFSITNIPDIAPKCHAGACYVSYWDGYLYLSCGTCKKPIGKIHLTI